LTPFLKGVNSLLSLKGRRTVSRGEFKQDNRDINNCVGGNTRYQRSHISLGEGRQERIKKIIKE
jgi:hypothetical protein